ncbi:MAG: putative DNA binding domain-containing protein [Verrucomicrobia bacterium]|nr:putative DNA binding domain-containing protein [Verrucomicrobiota bacterium]
MMGFHEVMHLLQNGDESERIEAKQALDSIGKSTLETICAFCNEPGLGGGYLLLGITKSEEDDARFEIIGVNDPDKLQCEIVSVCRQNFSIPIRPTFEIISHPQGPLLLVYIPEAEPHEKPVYITSRGLAKGAFRRIGPADLICTKEDLDMLYQLRSRKKFDELPIEEATKSDLDPEAIEMYRKIRRDVVPTAKELEWKDEDLLVALGALIDVHGILRPTVAGMVLFGKEMSLRRFFPLDTRVDFIIIDSTQWVPRPDKRFHTVEVREALVLAIPRLVSLIMRDVPKTFYLKPGDIIRKDIPLIPEVVIREAICNAVMHRDYRAGQAIQILRYTNRIEFRNPGYSLKPIDQLGLPGSMTRNVKISVVLHELNFAEAKGSGIRTMQDASREANLTVPLFESDREINNFSLTLLTHHFFDERDIKWLARFKDYNLTDEEARTLIVVREKGIITNADYRNIHRVDTLSASSHLRRLRDLGLLEQKGKGSATYYVPTNLLLAPDISTGASNIIQSHQLQGLPPHFPPLDQLLIAEIKKLKKRATPNRVKELILQLCAIAPLKLPELSLILQREEAYLRNFFMTPLIESNDLEFVFPDQPTHPHQAYRKKSQK